MKTSDPAVVRVLARQHYPVDVILRRARWYVAHPLGLRHLEEMVEERDIPIDHSPVHHWVIGR